MESLTYVPCTDHDWVVCNLTFCTDHDWVVCNLTWGLTARTKKRQELHRVDEIWFGPCCVLYLSTLNCWEEQVGLVMTQHESDKARCLIWELWCLALSVLSSQAGILRLPWSMRLWLWAWLWVRRHLLPLLCWLASRPLGHWVGLWLA